MIEQASAIPFRRDSEQVRICLITSSKGRRWGFPKGIIDPGATVVETALQEAHEEAGLSGRVVGEPLGQYEYSKWGDRLTVTVVLMEVTHAEEEWDEADIRKRRWVTPDKARRLLSQQRLRVLLDRAVERLENGH